MGKTTMNEDVSPIENAVIFQPNTCDRFRGVVYIGVRIPSKKNNQAA